MPSGSGSGLTTLLLFALPVLLLVLMFTSQRKRAKQIEQLQAGLAVGDEVVLTSGIYGTIAALEGQTAWVIIADGVTIRVDRRAVGMTTADLPVQDRGTDGRAPGDPDDLDGPEGTDGTGGSGQPGGR